MPLSLVAKSSSVILIINFEEPHWIIILILDAASYIVNKHTKV